MNTYVAIGAVALLAASHLGAERYGHQAGVNQQKVADQVEFDNYKQQIKEQTAAANRQYIEAQNSVTQALVELDAFKTNLENVRAKSKDEIELVRRQYATVGLRFTTTAKAAGCGDSNQSTGNSKDETPRAKATVSVQLPETLTANLRQLALDADNLNSEYGVCYRYVNR